MKWFSISSNSQQKMYELRRNKERLLTLTHHPTSGTIRISANDEKRVFQFGREGFLRNRTVLRNEYGIRMGQLSRDGGQVNHGNLEISGESFNYVLENEGMSNVGIYKGNDRLVTCELPEISGNFPNNDHDVLILTLCWYLAIAIEKHEEQFV